MVLKAKTKHSYMILISLMDISTDGYIMPQTQNVSLAI